MKIGLLGDTHGSASWIEFALNEFYRQNITTILQLGDFGIWPNGQKFLQDTNKWLTTFDQTMYVTPGNHEDYSQVKNYITDERGLPRVKSNIFLLPRGYRWVWDSVSFVSLGGAPSVDRTYRLRKHAGWWPEEAVTDEDVQTVATGGYADVMVCHDAPYVPGIERRLRSNPNGFMRHDLDYAEEGRQRMQKAFEAVRPKIYLHGHYHFLVNEMVENTHVLGLSNDYQNFSLGVLDTKTITAEPWDIKDAYKRYAGSKRMGYSTA